MRLQQGKSAAAAQPGLFHTRAHLPSPLARLLCQRGVAAHHVHRLLTQVQVRRGLARLLRCVAVAAADGVEELGGLQGTSGGGRGGGFRGLEV